MTWRERIGLWLAGRLGLALPTAVRDNVPQWMPVSGRPHDYDEHRTWELYNDALTAWRKNPIAWRIIGITSDFVLGDAIRVGSSNRRLERFIRAFWEHAQNRMDLRLESMCDELSRSGDLFVVLFRNATDGMSYIRFVTKDEIVKIETAANDWETELVYYQRQAAGLDPRPWYSVHHPDAVNQDAVMLHYSVNRPVGALLGESDLTTMLPWLQRYSQMLEDRVRLHWAAKIFLWFVTVPTNRVSAKQAQYAQPPESGSIIVKDESENWEVKAPNLAAADASHDLKAVRMMIDAGSGYPPHWRGESSDANLATAQAMQGPTERHLARRQQYFVFVLQDILWHAWERAREVTGARVLPALPYEKLFVVQAADVSRSDNEALARAARDLAQAIYSLIAAPNRSKTLNTLLLRLVFRFAGEPQHPETIQQIVDELWNTPLRQPAGEDEADESDETDGADGEKGEQDGQ